MAQVWIGHSGSAEVYRAARTLCYVRASWSDAWTFVPFLECLNAEDVAGPEVGRAELRYRFGNIRQPEIRGAGVYPPIGLQGLYVKVVAVAGWDRAALFYGVIEHERVKPWGQSGTATGEQRFTAYDLKHVLDRVVIKGSYTEEGYVDEPLAFNGAQGSRARLYGNMGSVDGDGANVFGAPDRASLWSALGVLNYLFVKFVNYDSAVPFIGTGDGTFALASMVERWDLDGMTVKQALDRIVDRRRGLGYRLIVDEVSEVVWVEVFTYLGAAVATSELFVPENRNKVTVSFAGYKDVDPEITFNGDRVDRVAVVGGPVFSTFTLSFADGTLAEGWDLGDEYDYVVGLPLENATKNDEFRRAEKYDAVFQRYVASGQFLDIGGGLSWLAGDGEGSGLNNAAPAVDSTSGLIYPAVLANVYSGGRRFERELPFAAPDEDEDALGTRRRMFGVCRYYDSATETDRYALVEALEMLDYKGSTNVEPLSNQLGVMLYPDYNHRLGLYRWDVDANGDPLTPAPGPSNATPKVDYTTLMITGRVETSERLKLYLWVPGAWASQTGKIKLIEASDAIAEYVVPGTVIDVEEGALVKHSGGLERSDYAYLQALAAQAAVWYSQVRASVSWTQPRISPAFEVGQLVEAVVGPEGTTMVGSPITRRAWSFEGRQQRTSVSTGFEELEYRRGAHVGI